MNSNRKLKLQHKTYFLILLFVVLLCQQVIGQTIVYPTSGSDQEQLAAKEVRRYIYLRTDQLLGIQGVSALPGSGDVILVANDNNPMVESLRSLINHTTNPGGFIIKTVNSGGRNILVITGNDSAATLHAAYRYAEHLGVGFDLAIDAIPDAKITLDITGLDEVGEPLFPTRGIQPFHDFYPGPDFWNTDDYMVIISQLPKLGMNFIGLHCYPRWSCTEDKDVDSRQGPEPTVWIGLQQDVNTDGTVSWSYPSYYAHTKRPMRIWGFDTWDTANFHAGSSQLFDTNGYLPDVMGETPPTDVPSSNLVYNRAGVMFDKAFTHAQNLGVKTAMGTELPMGLEPAGPEVYYDWVRGIPPELQDRLTGMGKNPADPCTVKDVYKGIFERIMKAHPLDYYWLWSWEVWSLWGVSEAQIQAFKNDILLADQALAELGRPFQIGLAGWKLGTVDNPAVFDTTLPPEAPFFSLWDEAEGFESLSAERVKWPATWMEEDWGLIQPQLEADRVYADTDAAWTKNCDGLITKHWRTRILSANIGSMKDLIWAYGPTATPVDKSLPSRMSTWCEAFYLDWATRQFGPEAAQAIADILAPLDSRNKLPAPIGWDNDDPDAETDSPGAIMPNPDPWSRVQRDYAFVADLEALRPQIVGAGNLERYDYWLKAMQCLRIMGEYGCLRYEFEEALEEEPPNITLALEKRTAMARLWEQMMTLEIEKATNNSDLGEIVNLEILNWKQLMMNKWDELLQPIPPEANPSMSYTGSAFVKVTPVRTQIEGGQSLTLEVLIMENPTSATLYYRPLGPGSYSSIPLTNKARAVYEVTIPSQTDDFEYYIEAQTPIGNAVYPVTAPAINQTVIVLGAAGPPDTDPPTPDPMTWASVPAPDGCGVISMTATAAFDPSGVQYYFDETTGNTGGDDSGWQDGNFYSDSGLSAGLTYTYQVMARDKSPNQNATAWSTAESATATAQEDCHVETLVCSEQNCGQGKRNGVATVTIYDNCGDPVAGADVTGTFTGDFSEQVTETTDGNGQAVLVTVGCVKKPTFQLCVDDVVHTLPYDSNDNLVTCCND